MTPTHRLLALSAVLLIASFAVAQATADPAPLLPDPAADLRAELQQVGAAKDCAPLRAAFYVHFNVWRGGVKDGHEPADELTLMRAHLQRIGWLEDRGRCGG